MIYKQTNICKYLFTLVLSIMYIFHLIICTYSICDCQQGTVLSQTKNFNKNCQTTEDSLTHPTEKQRITTQVLLIYTDNGRGLHFINITVKDQYNYVTIY